MGHKKGSVAQISEFDPDEHLNVSKGEKTKNSTGVLFSGRASSKDHSHTS